MSEWREKVEDERADLHAKIKSLKAYLVSDDFQKLRDVHKSLLRVQLCAMQAYINILDERLNQTD